MNESLPEPVVDVARKTVVRSLLAFAAVQGAVIGGLVVLDMVKKKGRSKRKGFPTRAFLAGPSPIPTLRATRSAPTCTETCSRRSARQKTAS
ncbi:hypothetical protein NHF46_01070 [Arthrobacter alpinus]|nr:hypothetical protein [Arthrobacter alpinus]